MGDCLYIHGPSMARIITDNKQNISTYMGTKRKMLRNFLEQKQGLTSFDEHCPGRNFGLDSLCPCSVWEGCTIIRLRPQFRCSAPCSLCKVFDEFEHEHK